MKKFLFFLGITLFLLLFQNAKATVLNFTDMTAWNITSLGKEAKFERWSIGNSQRFGLSDLWYIYDDTIAGGEIAQFSSNFSSKTIDWTALKCLGIVSPEQWGEMEFTPNYILFPCQCVNNVVNDRIEYSDLSLSTVRQLLNTYTTPPAQDLRTTRNGNLTVWANHVSDNYIRSAYNNLTTTGDITLQPGVTNVYSPKPIYVDVLHQYWIFYQDQNKNIRVAIEDENFAYINTFLITIATDYSNVTGGNWDVLYGNMNVPGYPLYVYWLSGVNNTVNVRMYDALTLYYSSSFIPLVTQSIDLEDHTTDLNYSISMSALNPRITYDGNKFWMFFETINLIDSSHHGLYALPTYFSCSCSAWTDYHCVPNQPYMVQKRLCIPYGCNGETQTVYSETCYNQTINPEPQNETETIESSCSISNLKGGCNSTYCSIKIPDDCIQNTAQVTLFGYQSLDSLPLIALGCGGNHFLGVNMPSYSSDSVNVTASCSNFNQWNATINSVAYIYQAGQTATGKITGCVDDSCVSLGALTHCLNSWGLHGKIKVECLHPCTEHYYCKDDMNSALKGIDCQEKNSTGCDYGCDYSTGLCKDQTSEQQNEDVAKNIATPIGSFINLGWSSLGLIFPSAELKILGGLVISTLTGLLIVMFVGKDKGEKVSAIIGVIALGLSMGLLFLFSWKGWLPFWISVMIAIPEVAFIVLMFTGMKRSD
jgi:hypothetical protein